MANVADESAALHQREKQVAQRELAVDRDRAALQADLARFQTLRSDFHIAAATTRDELRTAWAAVEVNQKRASSDWAEANRYFTAQTAALDARAAELEQREKAATDRLARVEADAAGLTEESRTLEQRVWNAREALSELERRRDRIRTEILGSTLPASLLPDEAQALDELALRERLLDREKAAVASLRSNLECESADLNDRRRLVAEQLADLSDARIQWQLAERQTVLEMEDLARALLRREKELNEREQRLIRAETRRREEAHDLWRLRLQLEVWRTKLSAYELRCHTERDELEAATERRVSAIARREAAVNATFGRWEQARTADHARLRRELEQWLEDRRRLQRALEECERREQARSAELATFAARAQAAEQFVAEALHKAGDTRIARRLQLLRLRWERVFHRKVAELTAERATLANERTAMEQRYQELGNAKIEATKRDEANENARSTAARTALATVTGSPLAARLSRPPVPSVELAELRDEVDRLAASVLRMEAPIDTPVRATELRPFQGDSQAA